MPVVADDAAADEVEEAPAPLGPVFIAAVPMALDLDAVLRWLSCAATEENESQKSFLSGSTRPLRAAAAAAASSGPSTKR